MTTTATYRIDDEPRPGALAHLAVNPLWPLLSVMLGGTWLGLTWFALNSIAVGSPTRTRELVTVALGFAGAALIAFGILLIHNQGLLPSRSHLQYALLVLIVWKLCIGYALYNMQSTTIEIYEYYGGVLRNGLPILLVGAFLARRWVLDLIPHSLWQLVVS